MEVFQKVSQLYFGTVWHMLYTSSFPKGMNGHLGQSTVTGLLVLTTCFVNEKGTCKKY